MAGYWRCGRFALPLDRTLIMGVVNVTPDSFSDGGLYLEPDAAVAHGRSLAAAGCDILDVGGESTRPGSEAVDAPEEMRRTLPVVTALAAEGFCVSIDTRRVEVAAAALDAGAAVINDVSAGLGDDNRDDDRDDEGMFDLAGRKHCGLTLMHMQGEPKTMQRDPRYDRVVFEVREFLARRAETAKLCRVRGDSIALDPGIGFGKTLEHNLALLAGIPTLADLGYPVLIGTSRKSMFESLLGLEVGERVEATLATTVWSALSGASVVRVHDAKATVQAVAITDAALSMLR